MREILIKLHRFSDFFITTSSFVLAYFIKKYLLPAPYRGLTETPNYYSVLFLVIIIWYVVFNLLNVYANYRRRSFGNVLVNMALAVSVSFPVLIVVMYLLKITDVSRLMMGIFLVLNVVFLSFSKGIIYYCYRKPVTKDFDFRNYLIIGSRERAKDVITRILSHETRGHRITGCLDVSGDDVGKEVKDGVRVIGTVGRLEEYLRTRVVDELIFAMPLRDIGNAEECIRIAEKIGVEIRFVADWYIYKAMYNLPSSTINYETLFDLPTFVLARKPSQHAGLFIKSAVDYLVSGILLLLLLPLFALIALLIRLFSKGPVFFRQERVGLNGRRFTLYKFRTMVPDAEAKISGLKALNEADGPVFKIEKDPRIIPYVGTFLRKTSLDELPQLINVLKGEMSLIGPRPPIPAEIEQYEIWQRRRLSMKPGLTCLWQISPQRNEVRFEDWIRMDLDYIDNWSLWLDGKIFFKTFLAVVLGRGR